MSRLLDREPFEPKIDTHPKIRHLLREYQVRVIDFESPERNVQIQAINAFCSREYSSEKERKQLVSIAKWVVHSYPRTVKVWRDFIWDTVIYPSMQPEYQHEISTSMIITRIYEPFIRSNEQFLEQLRKLHQYPWEVNENYIRGKV